MIDRADALLWYRKLRLYRRDRLPWRVAALHYELARRRAFARGPVQGEALEMLRSGRLIIGEHVLLEPGVWLTGGIEGRIVIGEGSFLNREVMVAAQHSVTIGAHCMFANGCLITDSNHRYDDLSRPLPWQGYAFEGPTRIGDNVWLGAHVVVTGGVTIGERAVIGANAVVTRDIPPRCVAAGVPARVIREIDDA